MTSLRERTGSEASRYTRGKNTEKVFVGNKSGNFSGQKKKFRVQSKKSIVIVSVRSKARLSYLVLAVMIFSGVVSVYFNKRLYNKQICVYISINILYQDRIF